MKNLAPAMRIFRLFCTRRVPISLASILFATACLGQAAKHPEDVFDGVMAPVVAHTKWMSRDGAPQNISAIAQTSDGFLWLGTPSGLFRFDGIDFASYPTSPLEMPLPSIDVESLISDGNNGLWIGFRSGGICHLNRNGLLTNYNLQNHRGPNSAQKLIVRPDGSLWAIADFQLYQLKGDHWENFGARHGLPNDPLFSLYFDREGTIWTSARRRLYSLKKGHDHFALFQTQSFMVVDMAETPNGELWVSDAWHMVRPLVPSPAHPGWAITGYTRLIAQSSGALWAAQDYKGVAHMPWGAAQSDLVVEDELSSEQTNSIFLDHDGNIWVGTARGLDRFHSTALRKLTKTLVEYYPSLAVDPHHGVWLATLAHPLTYAAKGALTPIGRGVGSSPIICDDHGVVWMADPIKNMLTSWKDSTMSRIDIPNDAHQAPAEAIGLDRDGAILISFKPNGLWRFDGAWSSVSDPQMPQDDPLSIVRDAERRVWLGYGNSAIVVRDANGYHRFRSGADGDLGSVLTFANAAGRWWAAGTNGLAYLANGSFHRVALARANSLKGISGLAEDRLGNLWLNGSGGILRIPSDQLANLQATQTHLEFERFDERQGVLGTATQVKPTPSAVADKDGPLWFSTSGEVISLSPEDIQPRQSTPAISIERVLSRGSVVADREHPLASISVARAGAKELEVDYAGIDLAAPEKVQYRYLLENEDKDWHDVGNRRQAFYANLPPGQYRFRLAVSSGSDKWIELTAPLLITVTPAFYQTYWFTSAVALLVVGLLYCAYILRVRSLTSSLRRRLKERSDERLRISRELHDTLLQSIHGLMLRIHFATEEMDDTAPARTALQQALERADDVFVETRQRIESLRNEVPEEPDFAAQLAKVADEINLPSLMEFRVVEDGESRFLNGDVQGELCRIAREAMINTLNHSKAKSTEIYLLYDPSEFAMKCSDDGIGIPLDILNQGRRSGHWGMIGMKERAMGIEAKLQVWSASGEGTQIEVRVPGRRAYRFPSTKLRWFQRLMRFRESATGQDPRR